MKKAIIIVLSITIMLGASGCMNVLDKKSVYDEMTGYMENKYGEKFIFIEPEGANIVRGSSERSGYFSSGKFPDVKRILVKGDKDDDGKYHFKDNYTAYLLSDEISDWASEKAKPIYGNCKVFFDNQTESVLPENFGKDTTLKEYIDSEWLEIFIFLDSIADVTKKDENIEKLRNVLMENKVHADVIVWYFNSDEDFAAIDKNNCRLYINGLDSKKDKRLKAVGVFHMNTSYEFHYYNWR
jgi:hypothetical protein